VIRRILIQSDRQELRSVSESARRHAMRRSLSSPSKKPIIMTRKYRPGGSDGRPSYVIEADAAGLAEGIEAGVVQDLIEPLVERMTWGCRSLPPYQSSSCLCRFFRVPIAIHRL